ncbi:MAG TPA: FAD/NAD(P)-binding oxidoreductase [Solirubrobacteraceae bacterium]|nr:FAD/NAD(P)-binding oxidoreductase [Solirubrobacteraceae bacterium]
MTSRIVILGGGTGGTLTANRLRRAYGDDVEIVVVDQDDQHVYQPGLLFVPFGLADPAGIVRPRHAQLHAGITFRQDGVDRVDTAARTVHLSSGGALIYDVLVIATGARLLPEETEGLTGPGFNETVFTFYTLAGATALRDALAGLERGRLVVNMIDLPVKCPVAPLEFCFLADWFLRERGVRDDVELVFVTPLDAAFTTPVAAARLAGLLSGRGISVQSEFATGRIDAAAGRLISWDEREIAFDLLVTIPLHGGAAFVERSPGLGDELGFVATDPATLQTRAAENVFAIGDATNLPTSKAGSVTHFEGDTLVDNIRAYLDGDELTGAYDGHSNCFVETGFHRALLIDFNYDVEPLPGRFPDPHLGPLPLLRESRLNHLAKLAFQSIYWHVLLPGYGLPGISSQMRHAGTPTALTSSPGGDDDHS